jgi:hypothetical protein
MRDPTGRAISGSFRRSQPLARHGLETAFPLEAGLRQTYEWWQSACIQAHLRREINEQ